MPGRTNGIKKCYHRRRDNHRTQVLEKFKRGRPDPVCSMACEGTATCASPHLPSDWRYGRCNSMRRWNPWPKGNHRATLGDVTESPAASRRRHLKGRWALGLKPGLPDLYLMYQSGHENIQIHNLKTFCNIRSIL